MLTPELVDRIQLLIERLRLEDSSLKKGKKKKSSYSIHELKAHDVYFEPSTRLALQFLELEYILYSTEAALRLYRKIIAAAMSCRDLIVCLEIGEARVLRCFSAERKCRFLRDTRRKSS